MVVAIGSDHGGFLYKEAIKEQCSAFCTFVDVGAHELNMEDDYPGFSFSVADLVQDKKVDRGIMICRTGVGAVIAMNKVKGIRAGVLESVKSVELARKKNDVNILSFGADNVSVGTAIKLVKKFLITEFEGGRHQRRLDVIAEYEKKHITD